MRPPPRTGWRSPRRTWSIENGGGYDDFIHNLADDSKHLPRQRRQRRGGFRPGDPAEARRGHGKQRRSRATRTITATSMNTSGTACLPWNAWPTPSPPSLATLEPGSSAEFTANATAYKSRLSDLDGKLGRRQGCPQPPPASRSRNLSRSTCWKRRAWKTRTPAEYTAAIEEGSDVPPGRAEGRDPAGGFAGRELPRLQRTNRRTANGGTEKSRRRRRRPGGAIQRNLARRQDLPAVDDGQC